MRRFLLDRIDTEFTGSPVRRHDDLILLPRPYETEPLLSFPERAISRTEITLNTAVLQPMPAFRGRNGLHDGSTVPRHQADGGRSIPGLASDAYKRKAHGKSAIPSYERLSTINWHLLSPDAVARKTREHPSVSEYFFPIQTGEAAACSICIISQTNMLEDGYGFDKFPRIGYPSRTRSGRHLHPCRTRRSAARLPKG